MELAELVRQIPRGRCAAYSAVGRSMSRPVSGFLAGKWMAQLDDGHGELPWWRVVKLDGTIALYDRDPELGVIQRQRLEREGVPFRDERVDMSVAIWDQFEPVAD